MQEPRPVYITIIAWLYLIGAGASVLGVAIILFEPNLAYRHMSDGIPFWLILAQAVFSCVITGVSAWFVLQGANWARWLLTAYLLESTVWAYLTSEPLTGFWVALIWSMILGVVLFITPSNRFFHSRRRRRYRSMR